MGYYGGSGGTNGSSAANGTTSKFNNCGYGYSCLGGNGQGDSYAKCLSSIKGHYVTPGAGGAGG